ncbi:L-dopachrome tautomerase-related protein [Actinacidiphila acididurans]|uniref:Gluconolaconase n=1 Tax=Actinacidiphila acididurans TaxID=2784346 RepID=A0ABS2TM45_9ACTN|nr:L-dopachrome tautomerase-related protein [Actinacidiphila acididurans]MBM9503063.1 gluconolaconase [Actinacidiphila acididurans]
MKRRAYLGAAALVVTAASLGATQLTGSASAALTRPAAAATTGPATAAPADGPTMGQYKVVAQFSDAMPTGITVSQDGRTFVCFPRLGDNVPFTVAELRDGKPVPYPDAEVNRQDPADLAGHFQSVQSVVVDPHDRLWVLDTGSPQFAGSSYGGPKLVAIDLHTNRIVRTILFPTSVVPANSYINDMRFDLRRGAAGMAFITDAGGPNGIIAVDLATGRSWRRLAGDPSTVPDQNFVSILDGQPLPNEFGSDGIAISDDGKRLYYSPLSSRRLASVSLDALADPHATDAQVAATVRNLGYKPMADGLESDTKGRLYGGDEEHNSIWRRNPDGTYQTIAQGDGLHWIDTLSVASDRHLYAIVNQFDRQGIFHNGQDLRRKPYLLVRLPINAGPVRLG